MSSDSIHQLEENLATAISSYVIRLVEHAVDERMENFDLKSEVEDLIENSDVYDTARDAAADYLNNYDFSCEFDGMVSDMDFDSLLIENPKFMKDLIKKIEETKRDSFINSND